MRRTHAGCQRTVKNNRPRFYYRYVQQLAYPDIKKMDNAAAIEMGLGQTIAEGGFFKRVLQIGISYRDSPINLHVSQSAKIRAGDRLPYLKVFLG